MITDNSCFSFVQKLRDITNEGNLLSVIYLFYNPSMYRRQVFAVFFLCVNFNNCPFQN